MPGYHVETTGHRRMGMISKKREGRKAIFFPSKLLFIPPIKYEAAEYLCKVGQAQRFGIYAAFKSSNR